MAGEDGGGVVGGEGGAGKDEVVGAVAGEVGVGVAFLVGGMVVVYQPAGEFVEGGGAAGGDVEVAAEEDVVVGGECFADEGVEGGGGGAARFWTRCTLMTCRGLGPGMAMVAQKKRRLRT